MLASVVLLLCCSVSGLTAYHLRAGRPDLHLSAVCTTAQAVMTAGVKHNEETTPAVRDVTQTGQPSFDNTWYAVGFSSQLKEDSVFGMRLWGEPIVLYRDADGNAVCVRDVCPHRSAPLSMGDVQDGVLRCFYHGWGFGKEGSCTDVPTIPQQSESGTRPNLDKFCATAYAVTEHEDMVWVWRGHVLNADASKLPASPYGDMSLVVDTTFDYDKDWSSIIESSLETFWLKEATVTALSGTDTTMGSTVQSKFDGPNVVRHTSAAGFSEELHILPIAAQRTRVLLRQRLPKSGMLSVLAGIPGIAQLLSLYVKNRNYEACLERVKDPQRSEVTSLAAFREWVAAAQKHDGSPYFQRWDGASDGPRFGMQESDDAKDGTYGLKRSYVRDLPAAEYEPMASTRRKESLLEQWGTVQSTVTAAALAVPAALITYQTVAPAVASLGESLGH